MELQGKTVAVTGAGRGLGRKTAEMIAAKGAHLALVDLEQDELQETARLCQEAGSGETRVYPLDVSQEQDVERVFAQINDDFDALDGLVNNAGITRDGLLVKAKEGQVKKEEVEIGHSIIYLLENGYFTGRVLEVDGGLRL